VLTPDRQRVILAGAVLAAHGLLLLGWPTPAPNRPPADHVTRLQLLPQDRIDAPAAVPSRQLWPSRAQARSAPASTRPTIVEPPPRPTATADAQALTPPVAASAPAPLRLELPSIAPASAPLSLREQMLGDARANSRPTRGATDGLRVLGDPGPRIAEETLAGEGRHRVRIGRGCIEAHESRMAQLDRHDRGAAPTPSQAKSCNQS
jgi:hypothetical protein